MSGGIEETSASFEARSAPRSYPTPGGRSVLSVPPAIKSASQQAYGRRGRALLAHPAHRPSAPERTFDVLRRPDIFTCYRQPLAGRTRLNASGARVDLLAKAALIPSCRGGPPSRPHP